MNVHESERMVKILKALANPTRLKIIALLNQKPTHLYALAKQLNLPYPLAHLHLNSLKKLGLIKEIKEKKKAEGLPTIKYYAPAEFKLLITPEEIGRLFSKERN
ncbi:MAG: winged helix-turn-helix domain-containing protein [Candidatus Bathyarchaeia archaeon]